jgi:hypothetical protein
MGILDSFAPSKSDAANSKVEAKSEAEADGGKDLEVVLDKANVVVKAKAEADGDGDHGKDTNSEVASKDVDKADEAKDLEVVSDEADLMVVVEADGDGDHGKDTNLKVVDVEVDGKMEADADVEDKAAGGEDLEVVAKVVDKANVVVEAKAEADGDGDHGKDTNLEVVNVEVTGKMEADADVEVKAAGGKDLKVVSEVVDKADIVVEAEADGGKDIDVEVVNVEAGSQRHDIEEDSKAKAGAEAGAEADVETDGDGSGSEDNVDGVWAVMPTRQQEEVECGVLMLLGMIAVAKDQTVNKSIKCNEGVREKLKEIYPDAKSTAALDRVRLLCILSEFDERCLDQDYPTSMFHVKQALSVWSYTPAKLKELETQMPGQPNLTTLAPHHVLDGETVDACILHLNLINDTTCVLPVHFMESVKTDMLCQDENYTRARKGLDKYLPDKATYNRLRNLMVPVCEPASTSNMIGHYYFVVVKLTGGKFSCPFEVYDSSTNYPFSAEWSPGATTKRILNFVIHLGFTPDRMQGSNSYGASLLHSACLVILLRCSHTQHT